MQSLIVSKRGPIALPRWPGGVTSSVRTYPTTWSPSTVMEEGWLTGRTHMPLGRQNGCQASTGARSHPSNGVGHARRTVIPAGEYFLHMAQARLRRDAGPRDGAPRCGRRWRAVLAHPTAPRIQQPHMQQRLGPETRAPLSSQLLIAFNCAADGRGRPVPGCR